MTKLMNDYQLRIARVQRYLEETMDTVPQLETLSRIACFSPYHFHRIFTALTGESVAAYRRRLVLQRAARNLTYTRGSTITTLAMDAGYDSVDAFSKAFRALYGLSPSAFARQGGALALADAGHKANTYLYSQQGAPAVHVSIVPFPPRPVAFMRHTGPYHLCEPAWNALCARFGAAKLFGPDSMAIGICHDDPDVTPADKCRMEVCFSLPPGMDADTPAVRELCSAGDVLVRELGSQDDYAMVSIKGPYTLLHPAYRSLFSEWLPQIGREPAPEPGFEIYRNSPGETPAEELLTEIYVKLLPK